MDVRARLVGLTIGLTLVAGCDSSTGSAGAKNYVDDSITDFQSLGWLGGRTQPLNDTLTLMVDGERRSVGGVVVRELVEGAPLIQQGARVADVIVRVGEDWIPVTTDMDLLVLEYVERAISSREDSVELGCWRQGTVVPIAVPVERVALEVGLPVEVERFQTAAELGVKRLHELQQAHGGYAVEPPESELAVDALAGLAFLSTGADTDADVESDSPVKRLDSRIRELLAGNRQSVAGHIYALMYLCEQIGPLPDEVLVAAREGGGASVGGPPGGGLPPGMPGGGQVVHMGSMEELQEMMKKLNGSVEISSGSAPSGDAPPPGTVTRSFSFSGQGLPTGAMSGMHMKRMSGGAGGPRKELAPLLAIHAPQRLAANATVDPWVAALVDRQDESGHWGSPEESAFDRFMLTCHALVALGMAQRIGVDVPAEAIERGVGAIRPMVDDGKLAALVAHGADRREEAGRAAHAAWALMALDVSVEDEFRELLLDFGDHVGREVIRAPRGVPFHVWAIAATRRARGIGEWQSFYDQFRIWLVAQQAPSGGFAGGSSRPQALERAGGEALATAIGTQLLAFQSQSVPVLLTRAENPAAPVTDGHGKRTSDTPAAPSPEDPAANSTIITDPKEAAKLLESLGVEVPDELKSATKEESDD